MEGSATGGLMRLRFEGSNMVIEVEDEDMGRAVAGFRDALALLTPAAWAMRKAPDEHRTRSEMVSAAISSGARAGLSLSGSSPPPRKEEQQ